MLKSKKIDEIKLIKVFDKLNLDKTEFLFIASDLGSLGIVNNKAYTLDLVFNLLKNYNKNINLVVPTATFNLIQSRMIFDINNTRSFKMGAFSEYLRKKENSVRSFHPIWSLSAIGPKANHLFNDISSHAYDMNSSFARLFEKDFSFLALGKHPRFMLSIIHHLEHVNKVPYRFKKGFKMKFVKKEKIIEQDFYLDVLKEEFRYKPRARNKKIFKYFEQNYKYDEFRVNDGYIYKFRLNDFKESTNNLMKKDPYCWFK